LWRKAQCLYRAAVGAPSVELKALFAVMAARLVVRSLLEGRGVRVRPGRLRLGVMLRLLGERGCSVEGVLGEWGEAVELADRVWFEGLRPGVEGVGLLLSLVEGLFGFLGSC